MAGQHVRFPGIGWRVEENSRDRAVTVTCKSDLPENGVKFLARLSAGALSASDRYMD